MTEMRNPNSDGGSGVLARGRGALMRMLRAALARRRSRKERAHAIRELRAWDDRRLKDIGLGRSEIRTAVEGGAYRGRRAGS